MTNWLSLRDAAKKTRVPRGWLEIMARRNIIESRVTTAGQTEVCLDCIQGHKSTLSYIETLREKLLVLLDGDWIQYNEIRAAIPSASPTELTAELAHLVKNGIVAAGTYTCRGKEGARFKIENQSNQALSEFTKTEGGTND